MLDEVDDDFRITIFKMKAAKAPNGEFQRPYEPDAYRMLGRGTVDNDYATQAINRVLRPLGLPDSEEMVNRFYRYWYLLELSRGCRIIWPKLAK